MSFKTNYILHYTPHSRRMLFVFSVHTFPITAGILFIILFSKTHAYSVRV